MALICSHNRLCQKRDSSRFHSIFLRQKRERKKKKAAGYSWTQNGSQSQPSILATASGGANRTRERGAGSRAWRPIGGGQRGSRWPMKTEMSARRRASWRLEGFWEAESEQKLLCRASRGSPWQRSGTRALPSQLAFANLYTKVLAAVRRIRRRCCKVIFTSQASGAERQPRFFVCSQARIAGQAVENETVDKRVGKSGRA